MAWKLVEPEAQVPETGLQTLGRGIARTGARFAETVADIPRNVANLPVNIINLLGGNPETTKSIPIGEQYSPKEAITKPLTGQYLEPQTETEAGLDKAVEDLTGLLVGGTPAKFAVAGTGLANLAQWGAKEIGIPEEHGENIKTGALLMTSLFGARNRINNTTKNMYKKVEEIGNSVGKPVPINELRHKNFKLERKVAKRSFAGKPAVEKELKEMQELLSHHDTIPFDELWTRKKDISRKIGSEKDPLAKQFLSQLSGDTKESLLEYGKRYKVPELNKNLIEADDLFAASKAAGPIKKFVSKIPALEKVITVPWLRHLILPGASITAAKTLGATGLAGVGAAGYLGHELDRLFTFLNNSPTARRLYTEYAKQATIGNAGKVSKIVKQLNTEAEKTESKGKWRLVS